MSLKDLGSELVDKTSWPPYLEGLWPKTGLGKNMNNNMRKEFRKLDEPAGRSAEPTGRFGWRTLIGSLRRITKGILKSDLKNNYLAALGLAAGGGVEVDAAGTGSDEGVVAETGCFVGTVSEIMD